MTQAFSDTVLPCDYEKGQYTQLNCAMLTEIYISLPVSPAQFQRTKFEENYNIEIQSVALTSLNNCIKIRDVILLQM